MTHTNEPTTRDQVQKAVEISNEIFALRNAIEALDDKYPTTTRILEQLIERLKGERQ